ncbi:uncharacterized protein [Nicotiana sylvestris]|uniref:uncharacterized protein n=1 Tax=Nicotiana sylvestris TaxID=4096 RepID=UPI00388CE189
MPGLDPKVAVHHLAVKNVKYPTWVSSIVLVRKKNGQIRVCVDFRDLNNACPKDEFPFPIPELMINATTSYEAMSFMDGSSGYNQIRMAPKDEELTTFRTPKGIYCYKAVKGQALPDFLADRLIPDDWELTDELPDEDAMAVEVQPPWKMYFDSAAHRGGAGASIVFVTPQVFGDSQLVVNQLLGSYEIKKPELCPYHDYAKKLMGCLRDVTIQYVPRKENKKDDALATLASSLALPDQAQVTVYQKWVVPPPNEVEGEDNELKHLVVVSDVEKEEWRQPIIDYLCYGILPENPRRRTEIRHRTPRFLYYKDTLYRRSFEGVLLRCLEEEEALQALQEAHFGGLDVIGPLPKSSGGHLYILAATDYFSKWAEAVALKEVKRKNVARKFTSKWDGPYVVQKAYSSGAYKLVDADGMRIDPINDKFLKKYYL